MNDRPTPADIRRLLVLAAAHLSREAAALLDEPYPGLRHDIAHADSGLRRRPGRGDGAWHHFVEGGGGALHVTPTRGGWIVAVPADLDEGPPDRVPDDLWALLCYAADLGAACVAFDHDAEATTYLPVFDDDDPAAPERTPPTLVEVPRPVRVAVTREHLGAALRDPAGLSPATRALRAVVADWPVCTRHEAVFHVRGAPVHVLLPEIAILAENAFKAGGHVGPYTFDIVIPRGVLLRQAAA